MDNYTFKRQKRMQFPLDNPQKYFRKKKILIIQFRQIGDVLLMLPMAESLVKTCPDVTVHFLTEKGPAQLFNNNPFIDEVLIRERHGGIKSDLKLIKRLRNNRYDLIIDGICTPSSGWMSWLSNCPLRIAFDHPVRRFFYSHTFQPHLDVGYTLDEKLVLLEAIGFSPFSGNFRHIFLQPDANSIERMQEYLHGHGLEGKHPLIVVAPTHRRITRRWPARHFAGLIDFMARKRKAVCVIVWGPGEEDYAKSVQQMCHEPVFLYWKSSLLELTALIKEADFFIGNDSAPRHIAVSQGTPSVAIHGATGIGAWTPPTAEHIAFTKDIACQPCNKNDCETLECLELLGPEKIVEGVIEHLDSFGKHISKNR